MAYITVNTSSSLSLSAAIFRVTSAIMESVSHFFAYQNTINELESLDDRLLADMGLTRYDIPRAARGEVSKMFS